MTTVLKFGKLGVQNNFYFLAIIFSVIKSEQPNTKEDNQFELLNHRYTHESEIPWKNSIGLNTWRLMETEHILKMQSH